MPSQQRVVSGAVVAKGTEISQPLAVPVARPPRPARFSPTCTARTKTLKPTQRHVVGGAVLPKGTDFQPAQKGQESQAKPQVRLQPASTASIFVPKLQQHDVIGGAILPKVTVFQPAPLDVEQALEQPGSVLSPPCTARVHTPQAKVASEVVNGAVIPEVTDFQGLVEEAPERPQVILSPPCTARLYVPLPEKQWVAKYGDLGVVAFLPGYKKPKTSISHDRLFPVLPLPVDRKTFYYVGSGEILIGSTPCEFDSAFSDDFDNPTPTEASSS
jgi:hypothetical protein